MVHFETRSTVAQTDLFAIQPAVSVLDVVVSVMIVALAQRGANDVTSVASQTTSLGFAGVRVRQI